MKLHDAKNCHKIFLYCAMKEAYAKVGNFQVIASNAIVSHSYSQALDLFNCCNMRSTVFRCNWTLMLCFHIMRTVIIMRRN